MADKKLQISNHDAYCVEWYRRLIADGTAEDGQRIAVQMHDEAMRLTADLNRANDECRQIDENASAVQKEYKAEIEQLKSDFNKLLSMVRGYCKTCKHLKNAPIDEPCRDCSKIIKQNYEFKGLE